MFVQVSAGSGYGTRKALYEMVVETILVLRDEGEHDNLAGNSVVVDFEGLTFEQAQEKAKALNGETVGHSYDGCHACTWSIEVSKIDPPVWFTYCEPPESEVIRAALAKFRQ